MKVALVYDRINKWGGAERVLLALHKLFPDAPIYTSVYDKDSARWADVFKVKTSWLQNIPFAKKRHDLFAPFMPMAFESMNFDSYDLVISITSEAAKGIITKPKTKHICYCLTPTRYLWSGYDEYFKSAFKKRTALPIIDYLRRWDKTASKRPDLFIAISKEVKTRIKKYYQIDASVIYPPVDLGQNNIKHNIKVMLLAFNDVSYFLVVSRLVPYKRIDLAVKVCTAMNIPLYIIGTGSQFNKLKQLAGPTIRFLGNVSDEELIEYYKNCEALLFPGNEDFGITIVEAQKFGKPVIAYRAGGALETIIENKTGLFFDTQETKSLINTLQQFKKIKFKKSDCVRNAEKFGFESFKKQFLETIEGVL